MKRKNKITKKNIPKMKKEAIGLYDQESRHGLEIKIDKLYKLRILIISSFIVVFCGAVAAITSWVIYLKPFEKFEYYRAELIIGNTFDTERVNLVRVGDSTSPQLYDFRYEIDGITYIHHWKVWQEATIGRYAGFYYLVSNPSYSVASRPLGLIMLPIVFIILCIVDFALVKVYLREREQFVDYNKISIFGGKHGKK